MKKINLTFAFILLLVTSILAQGIKFNSSSWNSIQQKAKVENKLIMLTAYTNSSSTCKWMQENTFTYTSVGTFYNRNFICVKIDMEKGSGPALAKKYKLGSYPRIFFLDGNGNKIHESLGKKRISEFIAEGEFALDFFSANNKKNGTFKKCEYCASVNNLENRKCEVCGASFSTKKVETLRSTSLITNSQIQKILKEHNKLRAEVGIPPLTWSVKLANYSQDWANELKSMGCKFNHSKNNSYGENLFKGTAGYYTVADGVISWGDEKKDYTYGYSGETLQAGVVGHYTQIVWRNTTKVGCGIVKCNGEMILVCNYDPPGNYVGEKPY